MENLNVIVAGIEYKLQQLQVQIKETRDTNRELSEIVEKQEALIIHQNQVINQLQEKLNNIIVAEAMASRLEISDAKKKIGDMVREIDRCIELLNK